MGVRKALGLINIGFDDLAPTIRSTLTGPRHTTSILSSASANKKWGMLEIWPNGVQATRAMAKSYVADNKHFRLAIPDVALIQGFPASWKFSGATYMCLGQIGNAVPPPLAYQIGKMINETLA